jgi:molybdopterin-biosynthesis enzyme MoeA-like protein
LGELQNQYPDVKMGSYPQMGKGRLMTELVLRSSDAARLEEAAEKVRAMLEALVPTLKGGRKVLSVTVKAAVGEGTVGGPLGELQDQYPDVKMGSYPQMGKDRVMTELVLRSADPARLEEAAVKVRAMVAAAHEKAGIAPPDA